MDQYLNGKSQKELSKIEKIKVDRLVDDIAGIWNDAISETALERAEKLHSGYGKADPIPHGWARDFNKIRDELDSSIYRAIWEKSPAWAKVEADFKSIKETALQEIKENANLPEDVRRDWLERIRSVDLTIPGTDPEDSTRHDCASTQMNAFYQPRFNKLTVCAGLFNTQEITAVMAHEFSHALGMSRSQILFERSTKAGKALSQLRSQVCSRAPIQACPIEWKNLRADFKNSVASLGSFNPQVPEFLSCLQYKEIKKEPTPETIAELAEARASDELGFYADIDSLLRLTAKELVRKDGKKKENPFYLNPCGTMDIKPESFSVGNATKLLFTLEYVCNPGTGNAADRLSNAAQSARELQAIIYQKTIPMGGRFSEEKEMVARGYAEHPDEAQAQKKFSLEAHSGGKQRRLETLNAPIREALGCKKDFAYKDCSL